MLPREEIYERVWGYAMAHGDRSVDVFVRKLRQKLEKVSPDWRYIHTHFGIGYRFAPERISSAVPVPEPVFASRARRARRGMTLSTGLCGLRGIALPREDGVQSGVQIERNREQLRATETALERSIAAGTPGSLRLGAGGRRFKSCLPDRRKPC